MTTLWKSLEVTSDNRQQPCLSRGKEGCRGKGLIETSLEEMCEQLPHPSIECNCRESRAHCINQARTIWAQWPFWAPSLCAACLFPQHHLPGWEDGSEDRVENRLVCGYVMWWIWPLIFHHCCSSSGVLMDLPAHLQVTLWLGGLFAACCVLCILMCLIPLAAPSQLCKGRAVAGFGHSQELGNYKESCWSSLKQTLNSFLFSIMLCH